MSISYSSDFHKSQSLIARLWAGGGWGFVWTPNTGDFYTDKQGRTVESKRTQWMRADSFFVPEGWQAGRNLYFGVNPTDAPGKPWNRSRNATVSAVNALLAEFDGKDEIVEAEWMPHYVAPALDGMTKARARGALQTAQTAAIDAAYKLDPDTYKRRALERLTASPIRFSAVWDSGGGYQGVALLSETLRITDDNRATVAHVQREFVRMVGGDPAASDLCRVLRLPGSRNHKPKYAPDFPVVEFLWCELDRVYSFDELAAMLPPLATPTPRPPKRIHTPAGAPVELGQFGDVPHIPNTPAVAAYNAATDLHDLLLSIGYTDHSPGRMNRPGADTGGVQLHDDNSASVYSSGDPLYCEHRIRPAHVLAVYEYSGDAGAMLADLARPATEIIEAARQWVRRADFAQVVPLELQAVNGYRTNDTDKAVALAALAILASYGVLQGALSLLQLSEATGRSAQTCMRAMARIAPLFVCVNEATRTPDEARIYKLSDEWRNELRTWKTVSSTQDNCTTYSMYATPYSALPMDTHRAHDAFVRSMRPLDADELARRIERRRGEGKRAAATGDERRRVDATLPSAGPAALVVADAIAEHGPLRGVDLVGLTHKSKYAVSRAVGRLVGLGLASVGDDGAVDLVEGWADHLNEITPQMPTYGTSRRRIIARADAIIAQCERIKEQSADPPKWVHRRLNRAQDTKIRIAQSEGFDGIPTIAAATAINQALTWWDLVKIRRRDEIHANARMDEAARRRAADWTLAGLALQLRNEGRGKRDAARMIEYAGYTNKEAWQAVGRAWPHKEVSA